MSADFLQHLNVFLFGDGSVNVCWIPALITGGLGLMGSMFGANAAADAQRQQAEEEARQREQDRQFQREQLGFQREQFGKTFEEQQAMNRARQSAYGTMLGRGAEFGAQGEQAFGQAVGQELPEMQQMKQDILTRGAKGLQQGAGQLQASLAQSGVRGGQAATQLRRGIGEMAQGTQMDVNKMQYEDAAKRAAEQRAYQASKAQMGQRAQLQGATY